MTCLKEAMPTGKGVLPLDTEELDYVPAPFVIRERLVLELTPREWKCQCLDSGGQAAGRRGL